ncbi:MAG: sugar ABC transporter ATP-binding protein [Lachnospiraceae bacterium]|nr:sugar ABC transporter ATP-binding protein [Lachnospiraceae bacterium]
MEENYVLKMENVSKIFPGVRALDGVRLEVRRGEIHALIGENGAGKSTLIKILSGIYHPDGGEIYIDGNKVEMSDVRTAREHGIAVIHQELSLAENMTVAENIFLGRMPGKRNGFVDDKLMEEKAREFLDAIGLTSVDPSTKVKKLSVARQQMVEICRALSQEIKILVMDEPTASLANRETETLLELMRSLKQKGVSIIFVSHKLNEVYQVCDRITVLRDGVYIGTGTVEEIVYDKLISMMVGRKIESVFPAHETRPGETFFEARDICSSRVKNVSFYLRKGEVLGFYGLVGSGRTETMRALLGIDRNTKGDVTLNGKKIRLNSPVDAVNAGIVLAPEDRKLEGLILKQTLDFNITVTILKKIIKGLRLNRKKSNEAVENIGARLRIKTPSYETKAVNLSGGNQQKVVLAKWLVTEPVILILDEPTRGIDVGAKQEIYNLIYEIVKMGVSVILISSEMPEVIHLCDRVYIMREGEMVAALDREELTEEAIMRNAIGGC